MKLEIKKLLFDIIESDDDIANFIDNIEFNKFSESKLIQAAVERKFEIIGEALSRIKYLDSRLPDNDFWPG